MDNFKPIVITRQEFADNLCKIVNEAALPAFVIRGILRDMDMILEQKEKQEYQFALMMSEKGEKENEVYSG